MIGGGPTSFIGPVHRMAARLDGQADFVAGVFSSDPEKSRRIGEELFLEPDRRYGSVSEMIERECARPVAERVDFISVVTPNYAHFDAVKQALQAGFHVICDKPVTRTLEEARSLEQLIAESGRFFALTHNYTGYPMIKQARHMVAAGEIGDIHKVVVIYPQGWMAQMLNQVETKIDAWRMDPEKSGKSCTGGDIGTHAENLVRYVTGLRIEALCADLTAFVPGNPLDDDVNVLLRYTNGARGVLIASQISTGEENGFSLRVYGSKAGLYWNQENPNYLHYMSPEGYRKILSKGNPILCEQAQSAGRLPFGHPDGFIEAFANLYLEAFRAIRADIAGAARPDVDVPGIDDGIMGLQFIETIVKSSASTVKWTPWVE